MLHVGAGSPLRLWESQRWRQLADAIAARGLDVVWTAGEGECDLVREIDPESRYRSYAGQLDLAQLWHLLSGAALAVTLDTGIAHMAKLTRTPTVALFGPGSSVLFGRGLFWQDNTFVEVTAPGFPCRDQRHLFKREVGWVRRCNRTPADCPRARCMEAISAQLVIASLGIE
jgi:ADP-heptose:LPS heptosyltransferase